MVEKAKKKILEILMETNEEEKFILFLCFPPYNEIIIILKLLLMLLPFAFSCLHYINLLLILRVNETFSLLNWPILNFPFAFLGQILGRSKLNDICVCFSNWILFVGQIFVHLPTSMMDPPHQSPPIIPSIFLVNGLRKPKNYEWHCFNHF